MWTSPAHSARPAHHQPDRHRARAARSSMRATAALALALAAIMAGTPAAHGATPGLDAPTWAEEFDGAELNKASWSYRATGSRWDGELTPDAVEVADGALTIKTYTEGGKHYSGMISTQSRGSRGFQQRYGYWEARVKFANAPGQWSAFWLQSPTIGSPLGDPATAGVETDIVEHRARCVSPAAPAPAPPRRSVRARRGHLRPRAAGADLGWLRRRPASVGQAQRQAAEARRRRLAHLGAELDPDGADLLLRRCPDLVADRADLATQPVHHPQLGGRRVLRGRHPAGRIRLARDDRHDDAGRLRAGVGRAQGGHRPAGLTRRWSRRSSWRR